MRSIRCPKHKTLTVHCRPDADTPPALQEHSAATAVEQGPWQHNGGGGGGGSGSSDEDDGLLRPYDMEEEEAAEEGAAASGGARPKAPVYLHQAIEGARFSCEFDALDCSLHTFAQPVWRQWRTCQGATPPASGH
jgi:hypothetical protein